MRDTRFTILLYDSNTKNKVHLACEHLHTYEQLHLNFVRTLRR